MCLSTLVTRFTINRERNKFCIDFGAYFFAIYLTAVTILTVGYIINFSQYSVGWPIKQIRQRYFLCCFNPLFRSFNLNKPAIFCSAIIKWNKFIGTIIILPEISLGATTEHQSAADNGLHKHNFFLIRLVINYPKLIFITIFFRVDGYIR